jgi:ArsR family transcriptional regulator
MVPELLFKALSDPTRLRILALLAAEGELCVCDLTRALALSQPMISRHLASLREAGIVSDRRAGVWVHYRLHPDLPAWAGNALRATFDGLARKPPYQADRKTLCARAHRGNTQCT